jgi:hypothetical protein
MASWWIWVRAPTDSIRIRYAGFWDFEFSRLHYSLPILVSVVAVWIGVRYLFRRYVARRMCEVISQVIRGWQRVLTSPAPVSM